MCQLLQQRHNTLLLLAVAHRFCHLWMKTQLADYGYTMRRIPIYYDSKSVIQITANLVQHSKTKHIDIRYHFIKDHVKKGNIELHFVECTIQLADLFTKSFDESRFTFLLSQIGMLDSVAWIQGESSFWTLNVFRGSNDTSSYYLGGAIYLLFMCSLIFYTWLTNLLDPKVVLDTIKLTCAALASATNKDF